MTPAERRTWARRFLRRAPGGPAYGTEEWAALPEGDIAKVAAVVRAAECWASEGDDLELRLRAELDGLAAGLKAAEDANYVARRDEHHRRWDRLPSDISRIHRRDRSRHLSGGDAA